MHREIRSLRKRLNFLNSFFIHEITVNHYLRCKFILFFYFILVILFNMLATVNLCTIWGISNLTTLNPFYWPHLYNISHLIIVAMLVIPNWPFYSQHGWKRGKELFSLCIELTSPNEHKISSVGWRVRGCIMYAFLTKLIH